MERCLRRWLWGWAGLLLLPVLALPGGGSAVALAAAPGGGGIGAELPLWSVIPFVGILLSIALFPLLAPSFWHHHFGKISAFWALLFALPFAFAYGLHAAAYHVLHIYALDYIPFIILLASLFVIAGGIAIRGRLSGSPAVNTLLLLVGTLLSSWIGTTGSSMLLIRPLLKSNAHRRNRAHLVVFFIFLVSNIGGSLTPIGDPPLFLGFLHGVDFFWTLRLLPEMSFLVVILLGLFFAFDSWMLRREQPLAQPVGDDGPLRVEGLFNFVLLGGVIAAVIFSGAFNSHPLFFDEAHGHPRGLLLIEHGHALVLPWINLLRDGMMVLLLLLSLKLTRREIRTANDFNWFPIQEVAFLFAGIFMTIIPALEILKAGTAGSLGFIVQQVESDASYFWVTGILSSFLDNAPTYLTFFNTALGSLYPGMSEAQAVPLLMEHGTTLVAISAGAVFMGANTYIGNAPNFMVKSIAEQSGVKMPSFFGYMLWSGLILMPLFVLVTWIFF
jgi:Na+/H+ antiporter NhaD/arsenite permease-like protein